MRQPAAVLCAALCVAAPVADLMAAPTAVAASAAGAARAAPAAIRVRLASGLLTLECRGASLREVLARIGQLAGFEVIPVGDLTGLPPVSVSLDRVPVAQAVELLLADTSSIVVHGSAPGGDRRDVVSRVWLLGRGSGGALAVPPAGQDAATARASSAEAVRRRSASMLRLANKGADGKADDESLATLTQALRADPAPMVRARAAMALGALKDERAVPALESAVNDGNSTVRSQAIGALGQVGGERATAILGAILLEPAASRTERVLAAQALWRQDSEGARGFLSAGAADPDPQVRRAASKAPTATVIPMTTERRGPDAPR